MIKLKIIASLIVLSTALVAGFGCSPPPPSQAQDEIEENVVAASNTVFEKYQAEINALSAKGVKIEKFGKFEVFSASLNPIQLAKNDLDARIRTDQSLSGNESIGQKGQLLAQSNQVIADAKSQDLKSREDIRSYIKAYGESAVKNNDVSQAVIYIWGVSALKELMKANNYTMSSVVDRVLN